MTATATALDRAALTSLIHFTADEALEVGVGGAESLAAVLAVLIDRHVAVTDLLDLADALEDVRRAESPTEARLRQPSVDEITQRIVDGKSAVTG